MSLLRWIQASAHHLPMLADESVQMICTSPPFFGLRSYAGEQAVEWPTVEYSPMAGLAPIRIQGCDTSCVPSFVRTGSAGPGCMHEWVDGSYRPSGHSDNGADSSGLQGGKGTQAQTQRSIIDQAYCRHCGGWRGGLGLEPTIESYIGHLILCLREWRRVLRADGTCWVNLADSYSGGKAGRTDYGTGDPTSTLGPMRNGLPNNSRPGEVIPRKPPVGLKPKDLCMIPARFALAAQADGWWLRSDLIWHKPNPMPESVTDRPTKSHEYIFLLAKSQDYFYDADAVREKNAPAYQEMPANGAGIIKMRKRSPEHDNTHISMSAAREYNGAGRNLRSVWTVATQPTGIQHFATWPEKLVETMIRAGSSAHGCCPACGKAWVRVVETPKFPKEYRAKPGDPGVKVGYGDPMVNTTGSGQKMQDWRNENPSVTTGWQPACTCNAGDAVPCTVLDPFAGSGTTLRVAARLGRQGIGVDISQTYIEEIAPLRMGAGVQMELAY